jgi:hypothetical protein
MYPKCHHHTIDYWYEVLCLGCGLIIQIHFMQDKSLLNLFTLSLNGCFKNPNWLPFTLKKYRKPKEELWKFKYFTMQKIYLIFKKNPLKILQDFIITL